jgi:hypothetical protein
VSALQIAHVGGVPIEELLAAGPAWIASIAIAGHALRSSILRRR